MGSEKDSKGHWLIGAHDSGSRAGDQRARAAPCMGGVLLSPQTMSVPWRASGDSNEPAQQTARDVPLSKSLDAGRIPAFMSIPGIDTPLQ